MGIIYCKNPNQKQIDSDKIDKKIAKIKLKQREKKLRERSKNRFKSEQFNTPAINKGHFMKKDFFNVPGIYFLYQADIVVYVGESKCVFGRIKDHVGNKEFDSFTYVIEANDELRKLQEMKMIKNFRPMYNIVHNVKQEKVRYSHTYQ